jgi:hypothetical protein
MKKGKTLGTILVIAVLVVLFVYLTKSTLPRREGYGTQ